MFYYFRGILITLVIFLRKVKFLSKYILGILTLSYVVYVFFWIYKYNSYVSHHDPMDKYQWLIEGLNKSIVSPVTSNYTVVFDNKCKVERWDILRETCDKAINGRIKPTITRPQKIVLENLVLDKKAVFNYNVETMQSNLIITSFCFLAVSAAVLAIKSLELAPVSF